MMLRSKSSILIVVAIFVLVIVGVGAQDESDGFKPLTALMNLVPDTELGRSGLLYYADIRVAEQARGIPPITDALRWRLLTSAGGESQWYFALPATIGPDRLRNYLRFAVDDMPRLTGISLFQIDQTLYYGNPPGVGNILYGRFTSSRIADALTERGYTAKTDDDITLYCGPDGCDSGLVVNLVEREPGNPFGGDLGRVEPLAVTPDFVLNSADITTLEEMLSTYREQQRPITENPSYAAAAESITQDGLLRQAVFASTANVFMDDPLAALLGANATEETIEALRERLGLTDDRIPVGQAAELIVLSDQVYLDDDTYIASIGLVFSDADIAEAARMALEAALQQDINLLARQGLVLQTLIEKRGGQFLPLEVFSSETTGKAVLRVRIQADLVKGDASIGNMPAMSGLLFNLWMDMLYQRDLLWLY